MKQIFGFGSLINTESLKASAPSVTSIRSAYIKGFQRSFSLWDPQGFVTTNLDMARIPFCALDIQQSDAQCMINGVVFSVDELEFERIRQREIEYKMLEVEAYDFQSNAQLGTCIVFSANKNNATYDKESDAQERYLRICLDGAQEYGDRFYQQFLETTFIDDEPLAALDRFK